MALYHVHNSGKRMNKKGSLQLNKSKPKAVGITEMKVL